jgi:hypothetical protein
MNHRRAAPFGALVLCALSICAFGAANASATGLTAVKCVNVGAGNGTYNNNHCVTPESAGGEWKTVALGTGTPTAVEGRATTQSHELGSTNSPVAVFKGESGGIPLELTCGKTAGSGEVTNEEPKAGEHVAHGTNGVVTYTECHASLQTNTTKICSVQGTSPAGAVGEIKTNALTSINTGTEHTVLIEPAGGTFTEFKVLHGAAPCFTASTDIAVKVTGKVRATANTETHSHLTLTPATNGSEFKANGASASFESTTTGWMAGNEAETVGGETF